jgi:hypothetical protein
MCWWCLCPTHGGRGQSRWGAGRWHLMLVLLCVLCCCVLSWTVLLANRPVEIYGGKVTNKQTLLHRKYSHHKNTQILLGLVSWWGVISDYRSFGV